MAFASACAVADPDCEAVADMLVLGDNAGDRDGVPVSERLRVRVGVAARETDRVRVLLCDGRGLRVAETGGAGVAVSGALGPREGDAEALALELADAEADRVKNTERLGGKESVVLNEAEVVGVPLPASAVSVAETV